MISQKWLVILLFAGAILVCLAPSSTQAANVCYALICEYSGGTPPEGPCPWLEVLFVDSGIPGSVDLLLEATNLIGNEFVFEWYLNLNTTYNPCNLVFSSPTKTGSFTDPTIYTGVDAFKADGDGYFDIMIKFDNSDGAATRFGAMDAVRYTITGIPALTPECFDCISAPDGAPGELHTAAHIGGIGLSSESGWISVPEPASLVLLIIGGLMVRRRR